MAFTAQRATGPLGKLQKNSDQLKLEVDNLSHSLSEYSASKSNDLEELKSLAENAVKYKVKASNLLMEADALSKNDEPEMISNFESRKQDEIRRLQSMQVNIMKLMEKCENFQHPDKPVSDKITKNKTDSNEDTDFDDESEGDFDDVSEEDDDVTETDVDDVTASCDLYIAISAYEAAQEGDLSIKQNEVIDVLEKNEDGWWKAQNEKEQIGLVPKNFLVPFTKDEADTPAVDDTVSRELAAKISVKPSASSVDVKESDDVTDTDYVSEYSDDVISEEITVVEKKEKTKEEKEETGTLKQEDLVRTHQMNVTDILLAMKLIPSGFRNSQLAKYDDKYNMRHAIKLTLQKSKLYYKNIHWDQLQDQLKEETNRLLRNITIQECRNIPLPGPECDVISRHIRICLFDGEKILSNIWKLKCRSTNPSKPKTWKFFSAKEQLLDVSQSLYDNLILIRTTRVSKHVGILMELSVNYIRKATHEKGEMSCGWSYLPLLNEETGKLLENKNYKLFVNGGSIYENGVELETPRIQKQGIKEKLTPNFLTPNQQPVMLVRVEVPNRKYKKILDFLPDVIITPLCNSILITWFRRHLADVIMKDRNFSDDVTPVHSPVMTSFERMIDHCDVMDGMRAYWNLKMTSNRPPPDKNSKQEMISFWKDVVMRVAVPTSNREIFNKCGSEVTDDENLLHKRWIEISELVKTTLNDVQPVKYLVSHQFEPFQMINDVCYHVISPSPSSK